MIFHAINLAKLLNVEQSPGLFYKSNAMLMAKPVVLEEKLIMLGLGGGSVDKVLATQA